MLRLLTLLVGIIFLIFAVLELIPEFRSYGHLFGLFSASLVHSLLYLTTGIFALLGFLRGAGGCKVFFLTAGILYTLTMLYKLYNPKSLFFDLLPLSLSDTFFFGIVGVLFLYIATLYRKA